MQHEFKIQINTPPADVFNLLCNKDSYRQENGSPVLLIEKTTDGPTGTGTCYREVVQMAPFVKSEILSAVTIYRPYSVLEERWNGGGMRGLLTYFFNQTGQGTELVQRVVIETDWLLKPFNALISKMYVKAAQYRLECIKAILETGRSPDIQKIKWWHFSLNNKKTPR
jgi:uncharacterized protein YndB with AHSA1/START domain